MKTEKIEIVIFGAIGIILALLICSVGIRVFSLETPETTTTYFFFGITLRDKVFAAILIWIGFVVLFYTIKKMTKYLSEKIQ